MRKITYNNGFSASEEERMVAQIKKDDITILGLPMQSLLETFHDTQKAYENGPEEVRELLMRECNLIYECNVCRNMFRSLSHFIKHKRLFCLEFSNRATNGYTDYENRTEDNTKIVKTVVTSTSVPSSFNESNNKKQKQQQQRRSSSIENDKSYNVKIQNLIENNKKAGSFYQENGNKNSCNNVQLINTNGNIVNNNKNEENLLINIDSNCNSQNGINKHHLTSMECNDMVDSIEEHQPQADSSSLMYQCPACSKTYTQPADVMKHLANEHKKPVRRLMRESMHKKQLNETSLINTMQNALNKGQKELKGLGAALTMAVEESIASGPKENGEIRKIMSTCIYCDKAFERRAALSTHLLNCKAKEEAAKRQQINIQEVNNENDIKFENDEESSEQMQILEYEDSEEMKENFNQIANEVNELNNVASENVQDSSVIVSLLPGNESVNTSLTSNADTSMKIVNDDDEINKCSIDKTNEKTVNTGIKKTKKRRIETDESQLLLCCKICNKKFAAMGNIRRHISMFHYRARRYGCKLCDYRGFRRYDIVNHLGFVHKMTGDRDDMSVKFVSMQDVEYSKLDVDTDIIHLKPFNEATTSNNVDNMAKDDIAKTYAKRVKKIKSDTSTSSSESPNVSSINSSYISTNEISTEMSPIETVVPSSETCVIEKVVTSLTRQSLRSSRLQSEKQDKCLSDAMKRPIRNRFKTVNKDFVYDIPHLQKKDATSNQTGNADTPVGTRCLRRRYKKVATTETSSNDETNSSDNEGENVKHSYPLIREIKRSSLKGSTQRVALKMISQGRAVLSTLPEIPANRPLMRPRLTSTTRDDMQAGPVFDASGLEAARKLYEGPLVDENFLEKVAKCSPQSFRVKSCLSGASAQQSHRALDDLMQKVDSMTTNNINNAISQLKKKEAHEPEQDLDIQLGANIDEYDDTDQVLPFQQDSMTTSSTATTTMVTTTALPPQFLPQYTSSIDTPFQTYPSPPYVSTNELPDSPTSAVVSDFEDGTDIEDDEDIDDDEDDDDDDDEDDDDDKDDEDDNDDEAEDDENNIITGTTTSVGDVNVNGVANAMDTLMYPSQITQNYDYNSHLNTEDLQKPIKLSTLISTQLPVHTTKSRLTLLQESSHEVTPVNNHNNNNNINNNHNYTYKPGRSLLRSALEN